MDPKGVRRPIGDILVEKGLLSPEQLERALEEQRATGKLLGEILVEQGAIERLALAGALGTQWNATVRSRAEQTTEARPVARSAELAAEVAELRVTVARLEAALQEHDARLALLTKIAVDVPKALEQTS